MKKFLLLVAFFFATISSFAHVYEIRVNQAQDGSLTWYLITYHGVNQCGHANAGLTINGVNYPIDAEFAGDGALLSPNVFATVGYSFNHASYATVHTPFLGTTLSVAPYSNNVCWAFAVGGSGSFTPPPPPVCTTCPITGWSNAMATSGNNNGTLCDLSDDVTTATIKVNHLSCASITGTGKFSVIYDLGGTNVSYGPYNYTAGGIETDITINVPSGASNTTQVQVVDYSYPCNVTHGLTIAGGQYLGEKETTPPVINCVSNISVGMDQGTCSAVVKYALPTYSDNCGIATIQQTAGLPSGSVFPKGNTTNTFVVTDPSGNQTTCSFVVTVTDNIPPTAVCKNITVAINASLTTSITVTDINNNSYDNCGAVTVAISSGKTQFDCSDIGKSYPVTMLVTDQQGLTSSCTAQVTVADPNSYCNQPPVAVCKTVTLSANGNCQATAVAADFDNGSSDPNGDAITFNVSPAGPYAFGTTNVTLTVTDSKGASSTCTTTVTVVDDTKPTIIAPASVSVNNETGKCGAGAVVLGTPVTGDNCGVKITTNDAPAFFPVGNTIVTWTVTDIHGNTATATQTVTVTDTEKPTITAPAPVSVNNETGKCGSAAVVLGTPVTADNCAVAGTTNDAPLFFPVGTTMVTWTVTDTHGNEATAKQTVTVTDNEHPTVITKNISVTLLPSGKVSIDASMVDGGSFDNCAVLSTSVTPSTFYCANIGSNEVSLTVTDIHGNSFSGKAFVTVLGEIPSCSIASIPTSTVFTGGNPLKLYLGYGAQSTTLKVTPAANGAPYTYAWSGPAGLNSTTSDAPVFTATAAGQYTFIVTTTNKYGCTTSCSITICVSDIRVPGTNGSKVYVCHLPPGNTGNPQTLSISVNAVSAHLGNHTGDRLGSCDMAPCGTVVPAKSSVNNSTLSVSKEATDATEEALKVTVMPNPSNNYFTLKLVSKQSLPVSLKVLDANGRIIDVKSNIPANSTIQVGQTYISGTYYAEMIQGTQRKVVQLMKVK